MAAWNLAPNRSRNVQYEARPRIALADDHKMLTDCLTPMLGQHFEIVAVAENGRGLIERVDALLPDAVVLDISMPGMNGLEAARRISQKHRGMKLIFLSMHTERPYVDEAFRAGASAYVLKRAAASELVEAIRAALAGRVYVSPDITHQAHRLGGPTQLTARQREALQLVAEGRSAKQIAAELNISPKTVEFHKAAIMDRVGLRTTAELTRWALEHLIAGE
jgi:DNA-binding NarL/FixJ family response regulator